MKISNKVIYNIIVFFLTTLVIGCMEDSPNPRPSEQHEQVIDSLMAENTLLKNELEATKSEMHELFGDTSQTEDFDYFYRHFLLDTNTQFERIKFPLTYVTWDNMLEGTTKELKIERKDWNDRFNQHFAYYADESGETVFNYFDPELNKSNQRLVWWHQDGSCGSERYYFEAQDSLWYLVRIDALGG